MRIFALSILKRPPAIAGVGYFDNASQGWHSANASHRAPALLTRTFPIVRAKVWQRVVCLSYKLGLLSVQKN